MALSFVVFRGSEDDASSPVCRSTLRRQVRKICRLALTGYPWVGSEPEVAGDGVFDLHQFVTFQVVHWVAMNVIDVDCPDLIHEETSKHTHYFELWTENRWLGAGGSRNNGRHAPRHGTRAQHQTVTSPALFVAPLCFAEINSIDRTTNHQASRSAERSSSVSRSASARAWASHTSRSSRRKARRITSLVRSPLRIAALMIFSSSSFGLKPIVVATWIRLPRCATFVEQM